MTIFLSVLIGLAVLIGLLLFFAVIIKKDYAIEREITINKPISEVFAYVKLMRNQEKYNVWVRRDPNVKIVYQGVDGTEGFTSSWEGNKQAGKGEQEIKEINDGKAIHIEIRFEKPFQNVGQTYLFTDAISPTATQLKYQMVGTNKFPMNLMNIIIDGLLGKDLEKSLANVKQNLEPVNQISNQ